MGLEPSDNETWLMWHYGSALAMSKLRSVNQEVRLLSLELVAVRALFVRAPKPGTLRRIMHADGPREVWQRKVLTKDFDPASRVWRDRAPVVYL